MKLHGSEPPSWKWLTELEVTDQGVNITGKTQKATNDSNADMDSRSFFQTELIDALENSYLLLDFTCTTT